MKGLRIENVNKKIIFGAGVVLGAIAYFLIGFRLESPTKYTYSGLFIALIALVPIYFGISKKKTS